MLSGSPGVEHEIAGLGSGADGFLTRPYHPEVMRTRVRSMLRHKAIVDRLEESETILLAMAQAVEQRDNNTAGHCERVALSGVALGVALRLDSASLQALYVGGYVHDIGKVGIPDSVLFKPGKLNSEEWEIMRSHPACGEEICRPLASLHGVLPLIRHHHERWDGSGYPDGLRETEIPLLARVLQVVDIYDALTHPRPYKHAYSSARALDILQEETDRGWRDREIVSRFIRIQREMLSRIADPLAVESADLSTLGDSLCNLRSHLTQ